MGTVPLEIKDSADPVTLSLPLPFWRIFITNNSERKLTFLNNNLLTALLQSEI